MNCKNCEYGLKQSCGDFEKIICTYEEGECVKITELEQQKNWLEGCKSELGEHLGKANDRIVELEKENELLKADLEFSAKTSNKNKQTVKEYQKLVDEYSSEGADLQDRIKELEKENAELKEKYAKNVIDCNICDTYCNSQLAKAREIILKLYNAGRDVLMCRAEEKAYDNLDKAINDRSIEQFLKEIKENEYD